MLLQLVCEQLKRIVMVVVVGAVVVMLDVLFIIFFGLNHLKTVCFGLASLQVEIYRTMPWQMLINEYFVCVFRVGLFLWLSPTAFIASVFHLYCYYCRSSRSCEYDSVLSGPTWFFEHATKTFSLSIAFFVFLFFFLVFVSSFQIITLVNTQPHSNECDRLARRLL